MKRLYRSGKNKRLAGLCGGIGEYFGIDPVWIRLAVIGLLFFGWPVVIAYIAGCIIVPKDTAIAAEDGQATSDAPGTPSKQATPAPALSNRKMGSLIFGIILVFIGFFFLSENFPFLQGFTLWFDWYSDELILPAIFLVPGIILLVKGLKKNPETKEALL